MFAASPTSTPTQPRKSIPPLPRLPRASPHRRCARCRCPRSTSRRLHAAPASRWPPSRARCASRPIASAACSARRRRWPRSSSRCAPATMPWLVRATVFRIDPRVPRAPPRGLAHLYRCTGMGRDAPEPALLVLDRVVTARARHPGEKPLAIDPLTGATQAKEHIAPLPRGDRALAARPTLRHYLALGALAELLARAQAPRADRGSPPRHRRPRAARGRKARRDRSDDDRPPEDRRRMTTTASIPRDSADVIALARRSIVGVRAIASGGTGLDRPRQRPRPHEPRGRRLPERDHPRGRSQPPRPGRVIWADVTRDLALILPTEPLGLPPLLARPNLPRVGEPVFALSHLPGQPFRATGALVSAVDRRVGAIRCFEIDTVVPSAGGPIIDTAGRVLGICGLDLPRGARRRAVPRPTRASPRRSPSPPCSAPSPPSISPPPSSRPRPTYRCPGCGDPYAASSTAASRAASASPTPGSRAPLVTPSFAAAERLVRNLLARLGAVAASVRIDREPTACSSPARRAPPTNGGDHPRHRRPGQGAPRQDAARPHPRDNQESFYRFLLSSTIRRPRPAPQHRRRHRAPRLRRAHVHPLGDRGSAAFRRAGALRRAARQALREAYETKTVGG